MTTRRVLSPMHRPSFVPLGEIVPDNHRRMSCGVWTRRFRCTPTRESEQDIKVECRRCRQRGLSDVGRATQLEKDERRTTACASRPELPIPVEMVPRTSQSPMLRKGCRAQVGIGLYQSIGDRFGRLALKLLKTQRTTSLTTGSLKAFEYLEGSHGGVLAVARVVSVVLASAPHSSFPATWTNNTSPLE